MLFNCYLFKVLCGYLFEKGNLFSDYVDNLYLLKLNSSKDSPDYLISKLLLNSLYGRLGMNPEMETHLIVSSHKAIEYHKKYLINNVIDFKNGRELISFFDDNSSIDSNKPLNISIPISAAITSYARIHMSQFLSDPNLIIFYTDTDSIFSNKPLPSHLIGKELGKLKLENIFKEIIFICPKVYGGITSQHEEITKIKGFKNPVSFNQLKSLLNYTSKLELKQDK